MNLIDKTKQRWQNAISIDCVCFSEVNKVESQPLWSQNIEPDCTHSVHTCLAPRWNNHKRAEFIRTESTFHSAMCILSHPTKMEYCLSHSFCRDIPRVKVATVKLTSFMCSIRNTVQFLLTLDADADFLLSQRGVRH